jgi:hypothetical protein
MRRRLTFALTAAAVAIALTACATPSSTGTGPTTGAQGGAAGAPASQAANGGGAGGGGAATVSDPCTLLTQAEVSTVVGKQVGPGSSADNPNSCDFQYPADGVPDVQAGVDFIDGGLDDFCRDAGASALGMSIETVSGVGDGACFIYVGKLQAGSTLTFAKGGRLFQTFALLGSGTPISDIKAADTTLAQDVLTHL